MAIRVLDANTISKISAGEVVERPSSVVKELVENSIDAGAKAVTIEVKEGGISYLRVTDNGCGIPFQEARVAFENHATSKLQSADGLFDIRTLGFRGEALPSIAAVSKITMTTRVKDADTGAKVEIEGGKFVSISEAGCPEGTTIVMKELFYNLPVRRRFLKKPPYEQGLVSDIVQKILLGNPDIAIRYISNGKTVFSSVGDGNLRHAALAVYGREYAEALREVNAMEGAFSLRGLIGVGDQARPTKAHQAFYINGRLIRCQLLSNILEEACKGRVTIGMHPMCALSISVPPETIDINVHPSKLEIRFRDEAAFRLTAASLLSKAFENETMIGAFTVPKPSPEVQTVVTSVIRPERPDTLPEAPLPRFAPANMRAFADEQPKKQPDMVMEAVSARRAVPDLTPPPAPVKTAPARPASVLPKDMEQTIMPEAIVRKQEDEFRLIGTLFKTYILLEADGALIMIDQHAAHERLNFESLKKRLDEGKGAQQLLVPYIINVTKREAQLLMDNAGLLSDAGYEIEPFGETDIQVRAVPFVLGQSDMRMMFMEILEALDTLKSAERDRRVGAIMQASCKHAVKAGDSLTDGEIAALIKAMRASDAPPTCPHGRPVLRVLTKTEIERMFKRIQ